MLVSWDWLSQYVKLDDPPAVVAERLSLHGLNHDGSSAVDGDVALDLEVTSNRPDCLSHIGVARELAAIYGDQLTLPAPHGNGKSPPLTDQFRVDIECPALCHRFTARLVRGVRVAASPPWLVRRLRTIGVAAVNNVVDISNYVMFECGQPLHTFDFAKLRGGRIIVREPRAGESLVAIDHRTYALQPGMCVIADAERAVGLGGVMGGAETEVSPTTRDVLIEAAWFDPATIRATARRLNLHSPASFRFERGIDPAQIQWASLRCAELLVELGGGQLADGWLDVGTAPPAAPLVTLRIGQLRRLLGVDIPIDRAAAILNGLGFEIKVRRVAELTVEPPSWRRDVTREADLVEEVGRIFGYEHVPDRVPIAMIASHARPADEKLARVRRYATAAGFDEAMTSSVVPAAWSDIISPWSDEPALELEHPMLGVLDKASHNVGAVKLLRRSLLPSLLEARRINEHKNNHEIELFEIAKVYLARTAGLPDERLVIGWASERPYADLKGIVESLPTALNATVQPQAESLAHPLFAEACAWVVDGRRIGLCGQVSPWGQKQFGLRRGATVAELLIEPLVESIVMVPQHRDPSPFPPIERDFNFVVADAVRWAELAATVRAAAGTVAESVTYRETFRDPARDGPGKKRLLVTLVLRSPTATLTAQEADEISQRVVAACRDRHQAHLIQ
jgi:phenylalanyl-tRNA synthetase beta chain